MNVDDDFNCIFTVIYNPLLYLNSTQNNDAQSPRAVVMSAATVSEDGGTVLRMFVLSGSVSSFLTGIAFLVIMTPTSFSLDSQLTVGAYREKTKFICLQLLDLSERSG